MAGLLEDPRGRHKVGKYVEATQGGRCHELVEPLSGCRSLTVVELDATKENIETNYSKGGVKVGRHHRCEIIQGRQTNGFIQRCPECPQEAALDHLWVQSPL